MFLLQPAIEFVRKNLKEIVGTVDGALVFSLLKMLEYFFEPFVPKEVNFFVYVCLLKAYKYSFSECD